MIIAMKQYYKTTRIARGAATIGIPRTFFGLLHAPCAIIRSRYVPLRIHHIPERLSALPDSAHDRQDDPPLVRRFRRGLDHGDAVLSNRFARRIPLRALVDPKARFPDAGRRACAPAPGKPRAPSRGAGGCMEARGRRRSDPSHSRAPDVLRGTALLPARDDEPAAPGMVRAN